MLRRSLVLTVGLGAAVALALATPGLASARSAGPDANRVGINNVSGAHAVYHATGHRSVAPQAAQAFPSSSSTVIGSVGFINDTEVGYFWSASRGDSVEQTFSCKGKVKKTILNLNVPENFLSGAETDWSASINGTTIGSFVIGQGVLGPVNVTLKHKVKTGGSCDFKIYMTNEVPGGDGSIALTYAGSDPHSVKFAK